MDLGSIIKVIIILALVLMCARLGIDYYFKRKHQHIKKVIDLAKED